VQPRARADASVHWGRSRAAFGAGYIEGALTQPLLWATFYNYANGARACACVKHTRLTAARRQAPTTLTRPACWSSRRPTWNGCVAHRARTGPLDAVVRAQLQFQVANATEQLDYWRHVGLTLLQFEGLVVGYNLLAPMEQQLSYWQLMSWELSVRAMAGCAAGGLRKALHRTRLETSRPRFRCHRRRRPLLPRRPPRRPPLRRQCPRPPRRRVYARTKVRLLLLRCGGRWGGQTPKGQAKKHAAERTHCSALIKLLPGNQDLLVRRRRGMVDRVPSLGRACRRRT
jgi:hypothetical protein